MRDGSGVPISRTSSVGGTFEALSLSDYRNDDNPYEALSLFESARA